MEPRRGAVLPWLRAAGLAALLIVLLVDFSTLRKTHFAPLGLDFDAQPLSYPILGLAGTVMLVVLARLAGAVLTRRDDYYVGG